MRQQINLYAQLPRKKVVFLVFERILMIWGLFLILLLLQYTDELWKKNQLALNLEKLSNTVSIKTKKLLDLSKQYPLIDAKDIEGSIQKLKQDLTGKSEALSFMKQPLRFSDYLMQFANAAIPEVWLTEINISFVHHEMELKGSATSPAAVNQFIKQLNLQAPFKQFQFELQEYVDGENSNVKSYSTFTIKTHLVGRA